uniref:Uncharacterized protein n=1 Tax=virus sp. ctBM815 TaxID=2825806 RepID=A0A8S5RKY1_9VIRU|nr:MAG TPA: hypothetical protein [virus sp. ctBM815]
MKTSVFYGLSNSYSIAIYNEILSRSLVIEFVSWFYVFSV